MSFFDGLYAFFLPRPPRRPRHSRPSNNEIYAKPLPLDVFPLPTLIPHNPLSVLHVAFVYLFQLATQPESRPTSKIRGHYSKIGNSINVTDPTAVAHLWRCGFFGKGSLSRSEPTWLDREKKRLGILAASTSEEQTAARREERRKFKNERARKEREAIEEKLMEELLVEKIASSQNSLDSQSGDEQQKNLGKPTLRSKYEGLAEAALLSQTKGVGNLGTKRMLPTPPASESTDPISKDLKITKTSDAIVNGHVGLLSTNTTTAKMQHHASEEIENQEHLQLTPEEAFFLTYALGILEIYPEPTDIESLNHNLNTTTNSSPTIPLKSSHLLNLFAKTQPLTPLDPFLLTYVTYHHFRSAGWVVRPGIKFGVDYLLYLRGPVFSHAEFAVVIQPAYTNSFWRTDEGRKLIYESQGNSCNANGDEDEQHKQQTQQQHQKSWHWFHCLQRVQSQVRKTLVVAWVDVPPPPLPRQIQLGGRRIGKGKGNVEAAEEEVEEEEEVEVDTSALLKQYKVREMVMKRWIPNRSRD